MPHARWDRHNQSRPRRGKRAVRTIKVGLSLGSDGATQMVVPRVEGGDEVVAHGMARDVMCLPYARRKCGGDWMHGGIVAHFKASRAYWRQSGFVLSNRKRM